MGLMMMKKNKYPTCGEEKIIYQNPTGPKSGSYGVVRGGSWYDDMQYLRAAYRDGCDPGYRYGYVGFRLVRTPCKRMGRQWANERKDLIKQILVLQIRLDEIVKYCEPYQKYMWAKYITGIAKAKADWRDNDTDLEPEDK
jgi:hypothetical protein